MTEIEDKDDLLEELYKIKENISHPDYRDELHQVPERIPSWGEVSSSQIDTLEKFEELLPEIIKYLESHY